MTHQFSDSQKRLAYGAFFILAFLFALSRTFPAEAVQEQLMRLAAARGWQLKVEGIGPSGLIGVKASRVTLEIREGVSLVFDDVRASMRLGLLLIGRTGISFRARFLDGQAAGVAEQRRNWSWIRVSGQADDLDLARSEAIRKMSGLDLAGTISADVDVELDDKEPVKSTGQIELTIDKALVKNLQIPIPAMGGNFSVPKVALGKLLATATIKEGKATIDKLEVKGQDVEAKGDGLFLTIQPRLEFAPISGKLLARPTDSFWSSSSMAGLRRVVETSLAQAKSPDGFYGFQLNGTLSHPQVQQAAAKPKP